MKILELFVVGLTPIIKVLLVTAVGWFLALDRVDILGESARKHLNKLVFFTFNPALVGSTLAKTIDPENLVTMWLMSLNLLATFVVGSALGWILVRLTRAQRHLKGLIIGACSAGNSGYLPIIIITAICQEKGSPFGAADACNSYGMAYASLTMAFGAIYLWLYVYNIVRIYSKEPLENDVANNGNPDTSNNNREPLLASTASTDIVVVDPGDNNRESLLASTDVIVVDSMENNREQPLLTWIGRASKIEMLLTTLSKSVNLKALFAPTTIGTIIGFIVGLIRPIRNLLIGSDAPLHVIEDSAYMLGDAAVPTITLILGANLLQGVKGSVIQPSILVGIVIIRYIFLPIVGIVFVRGAVHLGLMQSDPLLQFSMLLHYAAPPAMGISTITELFGAGQSDSSVILLWTYGLAPLALAPWFTFYLWIVSQH